MALYKPCRGWRPCEPREYLFSYRRTLECFLSQWKASYQCSRPSKKYKGMPYLLIWNTKGFILNWPRRGPKQQVTMKIDQKKSCFSAFIFDQVTHKCNFTGSRPVTDLRLQVSISFSIPWLYNFIYGEFPFLLPIDFLRTYWTLYTFQSCSGFSSLSIPSSVTKIDTFAFYDCHGLTCNLVLPANLEFIGYQTFYNCSGLTGNLILPEKLNTLGGYTFYNCSGLTGSLTIPPLIKTINRNIGCPVSP